MNNIRNKLLYVLSAVAMLAGMMVLSLSSFAYWNKAFANFPIKYWINGHARLITVAGIGIFCLGLVVLNMHISITELKKKIDELEGKLK